MEKTQVAEAIFELRLKNNISIEQLAKSIGESADTVRAWEIGTEKPTSDQMKKLAQFFQKLQSKDETEAAYYKNADKSVTGRFINYAGGDSAKRIKWKDLLSGTFKKGNYKGYFNTKSLEDFDINNFQKPFVYIRLFGILLLMFIIAFPIKINWLTIITGTLVVPLTLFMFTWELNVYHNLKFSKCLFLGFIGGMLSIVFTLFLDLFVPTGGEMNLFVAVNVAIVEEVSKALVVYLFIKKLKIKAVLPAIVVGMSVGTGFSVIESCMYAQTAAQMDYSAMMQTILMRGAFSIGGHTIWATISASAMVKVANYKPINLYTLLNWRFLRIFIFPVLFHTLWNGVGGIPVYVILTLVGLSLYIAMINIGLKEASYVKDALDKENFINPPN